MGRALYLECAAGISGDMTVAALLDAGADESAVLRALESLGLEGFEIRIGRVVKSGLDVCDFDVVLDGRFENHDHDMAYLHGLDGGFGSGSGRAHAHGGERGHAHAHVRASGPDSDSACGCVRSHGGGHVPGDGEAHAHAHRNPSDIADLIDAADMSDGARSIAHRVFDILAAAEAEAHGIDVADVHFHEVGALDSIADVVAASVALDSLDVDDVIVTELAEGSGTVRCQHGVIPVPVPAVVNIAARWGIPLRPAGVLGELVTPTGAAFAAAVRTSPALPGRFVVERVGMGAGKRDYATSGILRAMIIREA